MLGSIDGGGKYLVRSDRASLVIVNTHFTVTSPPHNTHTVYCNPLH